MAEKRKKGSAVEFGDFDMDEATINRIKSERAESADRVARFNNTFVPTGSAFKDTSALSGTSRDVKNMRQADLLLDKAADRGVTVRGQDIQLELGRGEIGVNTERNRINEKGIDVQRELGLGELAVNSDRNRIHEKGIDKQYELGKGELDINKAILAMQQDRYNNVTKPSDKFSLAERAAGARVGAADAGFELSDDLFKETEKYLKDGKPHGKIVDETGIYFDNVPNTKVPNSDKFLGSILNSDEFQSATATGLSFIDKPLAKLDDLFNIPNRVAKQRAVRNSLRRKVRKVN